jgi:large subunit ribosomal protein L33
MAKKSVKVRLVSAAGSGDYYTTIKNPKTPKLKLRKYDKKTRKHEWFEEKKIK